MSRVCSEAGCGTVLSNYNADTRCRRHAEQRLKRLTGNPRRAQALRPAWQLDAECAGAGDDGWIFFPETDGPEARPDADAVLRAKPICHRCPVIRHCLEYAFAIEPYYHTGIWGGTTGEERSRAAHRPDRIEFLMAQVQVEIASEPYRRFDHTENRERSTA